MTVDVSQKQDQTLNEKTWRRYDEVFGSLVLKINYLNYLLYGNNVLKIDVLDIASSRGMGGMVTDLYKGKENYYLLSRNVKMIRCCLSNIC